MFDELYRAASVGGEVLLEYFNQEISISEKGSHHNVVTIADTTAQKKIHDSLLDSFAKSGYDKEKIGFIGEENLHDEKEFTFIIDPLDGTSNFTSGLDIFCVSIALYRNRQPLAGLIYYPVNGTVFYAEAGKGAFKQVNDVRKPLHIKHLLLSRSLLLTNISSSDHIRREILTLSDRAMRHFKNIRALGAAAYDLALLADNHAGAVVYGKTSVWDVAAGVIIVRESGGEIYDWDGHEVTIDLEDRKKIYRFAACGKGRWPEIAEWIKEK